MSYTYANGNVESIASSNTNGVSVTLTWDELNRLSTVIDNRLPAGANTAIYTYDPAGNVATATYPNGFQTTFSYDQLSRLTAVSTPVSSYNYQLGPTGNRIGASEGNGRTLTWNYDGIYRLTNETISSDPANNNGSAAYGLDPVGNRLSANSTLSAITSGSWTYNADDEISSETYDANGNVLSGGGVTYAYDSENHMISMTGNGKVVTMVYDAFGNRVSKTVNGVTTQYLVEDDVNPTGLPQVLEEVQNGTAVRTYTYGLQRISESQMLNGAWTTSFYVYDGAGSVRQLTNSTGVVTDEYEYDAYGNSFTKQGTTPNNYLYRGEQYDSDLGLYYLRARYYNVGTGRFMSRDPEVGVVTDPATLHKYIYAGGDPVNAKDPTGREAQAATAQVDAWQALKETVALMAFTATVTCALNKSAQFVEGITANMGNKMFFQSPGLCTEQVVSCKTLYPYLIPIDYLPPWYEFESQGEAASVLQDESGSSRIVPRTFAPATSGPCPVGGEYDPGWHVNYNFQRGGAYAGSVVGCPVCDDSGSYPVPSQRWGTAP